MLLIISILPSVIYTTSHLQNVLPKSAHSEFHFHTAVRNIRWPATTACSRTHQELKWNLSVGLVLSLDHNQVSPHAHQSLEQPLPACLDYQPNKLQVNLTASAHVRFRSLGPWPYLRDSKGPICYTSEVYEEMYCFVLQADTYYSLFLILRCLLEQSYLLTSFCITSFLK